MYLCINMMEQRYQRRFIEETEYFVTDLQSALDAENTSVDSKNATIITNRVILCFTVSHQDDAILVNTGPNGRLECQGSRARNSISKRRKRSRSVAPPFVE
jgi:hypothetical protein